MTRKHQKLPQNIRRQQKGPQKLRSRPQLFFACDEKDTPPTKTTTARKRACTFLRASAEIRCGGQNQMCGKSHHGPGSWCKKTKKREICAPAQHFTTHFMPWYIRYYIGTINTTYRPLLVVLKVLLVLYYSSTTALLLYYCIATVLTTHHYLLINLQRCTRSWLGKAWC